MVFRIEFPIILSFNQHPTPRPNRRKVFFTTGFVGVVAFSLFMGVLPANADPLSEADSAAAAVAVVAPIQLTLDSVLVDGDSLSTPTVGGYVDIPLNPSDRITLSSDARGNDFSISLPDLEGTSDASVATDGTVVYTTSEATAIAVQPSPVGVRMLTVLKDRSAPTSFDYALDLPTGGSAMHLTDGSVSVLSADGTTFATAAIPWARDSRGVSVPTRYELHGSTLTQIVEHTNGNFAYPITADPSWQWFAAVAMCVLEIASFAVVGLKAAVAFSKVQKIITASKTMVNAYAKLGSNMSNVLSLVVKSINNRNALSVAQISALQELLKSAGGTIMQILGVGSCWGLFSGAIK